MDKAERAVVGEGLGCVAGTAAGRKHTCGVRTPRPARGRDRRAHEPHARGRARGEGSPRVVGRGGDARAPREQAVCGVGAVQPARVQTGAVTVREAHRGRRIQGEGAGLVRELYIGALHVPARRPLNLGTSLLTVHMVFKCTLELKFTMLFVSLNDGTPY